MDSEGAASPGGSRDSGTDSGPPGECSDPGETRCSGDSLYTCDGREFVDPITCALGCLGKNAPAHCALIRPSFLDGLDGIWAGTGRILLPEPEDGETITYTVNGDTGVVADQHGTMLRGDKEGVENGVFYQRYDNENGGPGMAVVSLRQLSVPAGVTIRVKGSRAVALIALEDIDVSGTVDLTALGSDAGPGGQPGGTSSVQSCVSCGGPGAFDAAGVRGGGGGGGNGGTGGAGGAHTAGVTVAGGAAGQIFEPAGVLFGGGGGGSARFRSGNQVQYIYGGGGGGAMLLVSQTRITISGSVNAGGGGGAAGKNFGGGDDLGGGAGGGAGGSLYIESPVVTITGTVAANGGGGGASKGVAAINGTAGQTGKASDAPALGGTPANGDDNSVSGGNGAAGESKSGAGGTPGDANAGGGSGGGGGPGRIHIAANTLTTEGAVISPAPRKTKLKTQ